MCVHVMGKWFENLFVYMYIYCHRHNIQGGRGGGIHKCNLLLPYRAAGQHYIPESIVKRQSIHLTYIVSSPRRYTEKQLPLSHLSPPTPATLGPLFPATSSVLCHCMPAWTMSGSDPHVSRLDTRIGTQPGLSSQKSVGFEVYGWTDSASRC